MGRDQSGWDSLLVAVVVVILVLVLVLVAFNSENCVAAAPVVNKQYIFQQVFVHQDFFPRTTNEIGNNNIIIEEARDILGHVGHE